MPVCWDDWVTYWNSCMACASKNIDAYRDWECPVCDDETGLCSLWDVWDDEWDISDQEIKEVYIEIPTPNF